MKWKVLVQAVKKLIQENSFKIWQSYLYLKYPDRVIQTCTVSANKDQIFYNLDFMSAIPMSKGDIACRLVRKLTGQYILLRHGLPKSKQQCPIVVLLPTAALLKELGAVEFSKFLKEWPGKSEVDNISVVEYTVLS